ncbi:MAG: histidine kinase [Acidobacteriota bacterium]
MLHASPTSRPTARLRLLTQIAAWLVVALALVTVPLPPWARLLTVLLYGIALGFQLAQRGRHDTVNALSLARREGQLAQARLDTLAMQLDPHFLFNTLNTISALIHRDPASADRMITLLSDLLRRSLADDGREVVPLSEDLSLLDLYLAIERMRFLDRLDVRLDIEPDCRQVPVPRFLVQPLVENAIVNGIARRSTAGRVAIHARRLGRLLRVEVVDDGPGPPAGGIAERAGLAKLRARLAHQYGDDVRLIVDEAEHGGTRARLDLPLAS